MTEEVKGLMTREKKEDTKGILPEEMEATEAAKVTVDREVDMTETPEVAAGRAEFPIITEENTMKTKWK